MDNFTAFVRGEASRGEEPMVFDWDKAATIIKERGAKEASAGLQRDWEYTGGPILEKGAPISKDKTYVYLASTWAVPELKIGNEVIPCYKMQSETPNWDAHTYWPKSALKIIGFKLDESGLIFLVDGS